MYKKIGVITINRCLNFGTVLQSYAIKKKLCQICDSSNIEIIDYVNKKINGNDYKLIDFSSIRSILKSVFYIFFKLVKKHRFNRFIKRYILDSGSITYSKKTIMNINSHDLYIAGSDQIWNYNITGNDATYFLNFTSSPKASYASSFGFDDIFDINKEEYLRYLKDFNEISLREPIGYDLIFAKIKTPHIHIDPTLLLNELEWKKFVKIKNKKYILIYNVLIQNKIYEKAKILSRQKKIKIIELNGGLLRNPTFIKKISDSPEDFLSFIANAEYVFTTSFHGTVFSILFKRRFFAELNCVGKYNHRVENLLSILGLQDRAIENFNGDFDKEINWVSVEEKLNIERQKSFDYLKRITDI